jgi:hypothetical protein
MCFFVKILLDLQPISGYSAVRLAHLLWEQGVGSSNLSTPTSNDKAFRIIS